MTRFFVALCCALILFACKPGVPDDVIKPEEMEEILYDIHLVDGYINYIPTPDSAKKVASPYYKGIFKKYGIDSAKHARSLAYYYTKPDVFLKMYENIGKRLENTKKKVAEEEERAEKSAEKKVKQLDTLRPADTLSRTQKVIKPVE